MATTLFLRAEDSDYSTGNNDAKLNGSASWWISNSLATTRGSSDVGSALTSTVAGTTNGVEVLDPTSSLPMVFYSPPLGADVTISGSITWNLWAAESNMSANVAINGRLEVIAGSDGTITLIDQTARVTEVAVTTAAVNNFAETPAAGVACKRGDRLRVRIFGDDAGTMGSGFTFFIRYSGPTGGASGDSFLTLTETLSFESEPAGTTIYPTDTASDVATSAVDREAWTARGAGVQNDVTNTVTGPTAPIQVTDTAGGTVADWWTKQLTAFTLGGAVRCNIRAECDPSGARAVMRVEIAIANSDGSSPVTWGGTTMYIEGGMGTTEAAQSFLVSGNDTSVTDGQRLRIRLLIDDAPNAMIAGGNTVITYYAGTSGGASGDTYLTFAQTLTEFVTVERVPRFTPYPQLLAQ